MSDPEPDPSRVPDRPKSSVWEAPAIGLGFVLAIAVVAWWMSRGTTPEEGRVTFAKAERDPNYTRFVGDRACRDCHPGESAAHSRSGHSRTLRLANKVASARRLDGREVADPESPGVSWRFTFEHGRLSADRKEEGQVERFPIEYAFGSGRHAITFVSRIDRDPAHPTILEHRLTEFAHNKGLDLTPGQKATTHSVGNTPHGRVHDGWNTLKCFGCHATALSDRGPSFLDEATMIPNISCERCHGPAQGHVEAARRGAQGDALAMPIGPEGWSAARQMERCGECHRVPEMVTPGDIRVDNPALVRHQPVGLMQSSCFQKSDGALGCVTCHDPHARSSPDRSGYQAACLACHGAGSKSPPCPVSPLDGCVDCHMPRRDVGRGMMMTDHWIRIIPGAVPQRGTPE